MRRANAGAVSGRRQRARAVRPRLGAFVLYLLHYQLLPEKRLVELMADLLGVTLAAATIARISLYFARRFQGFANVVRDHIAAAPVKHMDETGFRIGGKTRWLHVACTALLTYYHVCTKRGSLLANVAGIVVHDHWKPYYTMPGVLHALCNAHHVRELKALVEIEKEEWARKMQRLLRRACHAANLARERGGPPKPSLIALIERRYDPATSVDIAVPRVPCRKRLPIGVFDALPVVVRNGELGIAGAQKRERKFRRCAGHHVGVAVENARYQARKRRKRPDRKHQSAISVPSPRHATMAAARFVRNRGHDFRLPHDSMISSPCFDLPASLGAGSVGQRSSSPQGSMRSITEVASLSSLGLCACWIAAQVMRGTITNLDHP